MSGVLEHREKFEVISEELLLLKEGFVPLKVIPTKLSRS